MIFPGRGRSGPFGALLAAAVREPAAARGLALAYASLDAVGRKHIIEAAVADAHAEAISVAGVLAALLAVEEDAELAALIANMMKQDGGASLQSNVGPRALVAGDETDGGVLLVRPLHGTFVEALALAWKNGTQITHQAYESMVDDQDASNLLARLPPMLRFEEMPLRFVIDRLTPVVWAHRRQTGELPTSMDRFADLFTITPEIEP